jgi:hypothetical protein
MRYLPLFLLLACEHEAEVVAPVTQEQIIAERCARRCVERVKCAFMRENVWLCVRECKLQCGVPVEALVK